MSVNSKSLLLNLQNLAFLSHSGFTFFPDLEPLCQVPYDLSYEDGLHSVKSVKEHIFRFIVDYHRKSGTIPLCLNLSSPVYKTFQRYVVFLLFSSSYIYFFCIKTLYRLS